MHGVVFFFAFVQLATLLLATTAAFNTNINVPSEQPIGPIHTLILTRHGDSYWNGKYPGCQETFTGWSDIPLSPIGEQEAIRTGQLLTEYTSQINIDAMFTSTLTRAKMTAHHCYWAYTDLIQEQYRSQKHYQYYNLPNTDKQSQKSVTRQEQQQFHTPAQFVIDYRLNERHYGSLQGIVKAEAELGLHGHSPDDIYQWRRSWHAVPPQLDDDDPRRLEEIRKHGAICNGPDNIPKGESLEMVAQNRIRPFLDETLTPILDKSTRSKSKEEGGTALVVAHANSLRALIGVICNIEQQEGSDEALRRLENMKIPTASPLIIQYRKTSKNGLYCPVDALQHRDSRNELPVYPLSTLPLLLRRSHSYHQKESDQALESSLADEVMVMSS